MFEHADTVASILESVIKDLPKKQRPSRLSLQSFSEDASLVISGLRVTHLVDALTLSLPIWEAFVEKLRESSHELFDNTNLVVTHDTSQVFITNLPCLRRWAFGDGGLDCTWTTPVRIPDLAFVPNTEISIATRACYLALKEMMGPDGDAPTILRLPETSPAALTTLAGYILEYPFAYVPPEQGDIGLSLSNVELSVFSCCLVSREAGSDRRHIFMKFSCPGSLLNSDRIEQICADITSLFTSRIGHWRSNMWIDVGVEHSAMGYVAL